MSKILIDEATVKLALDYLNGLIRGLKMDDKSHAHQVAAALREALEEPDFWEGYVPEPDKRQQALDKKAENARELGLDYEAQETDRSVMYTYPSKPEPIPCGKPVGILMKKKGDEHMKLYPLAEQSAQPTVPQDIPDLIAGALGVSRGTAYDMMREALEEQPAPVAKPHEQEPVAAECKFDCEETWGRCSIEHHNLVQSEPEKWPGYQTRLLYTRPQAQKPEHPSQEPVAWPADMLERIDAAIKRITSGQGCMRVPPDKTDPDLVLAEIYKLIKSSRPQAREPLTDEEIWKFWWSRPEVPEGEDDSMEAEFVAAVRAVLAAHGIKENT